MSILSDQIKGIEDLIEKALWGLEINHELIQALEEYQQAEAKLEALMIKQDDHEYKEQQRVLSYSLMRQGNILRQLGKPQAALALSEREINSARGSGDEITLARSLMSNGTNLIVAGKIGQGTELLDEARQIYERGNSYDHLQGLGWCWILQADLANAGIVEREPAAVIESATHALELLKPIGNWPGVARAYSARAKAYEKLGDQAAAKKDKDEQKLAEAKIGPASAID